MADTTHVKGLDQLYAFLQQFPAKFEQNVGRGGLRAGMTKATKPAVQANIHQVSGELAKGLKVSTRARGGVVTATLRATGPHAHVAKWIEYGVKPHIINPRSADSLFFAGIYAKSVKHPGFKGIGFMRKGLETSASQVLIAVGEYTKKRLTKQGLDVSDITVEGDG